MTTPSDDAAVAAFERAASQWELGASEGQAIGAIGGYAATLSIDASPAELVLWVRFPTALDLGLRVLPRTFSGPVEEDDPFESAFSMGGDEPGRVADLVAASARDGLVELLELVTTLALDDQGLHARWGAPSSSSEAELERIAALASSIVGALDEASRMLRSSVRLEAHADVLARYARNRGWSFAPTPIRVEGVAESFAIGLWTERVGWHRHRMTLEASSLRSGRLDVRRMSLRDTVADGATTALALGDEAFERRFRFDDDRGRLGEARLRALLLELDERVGAVRLEDGRLRVEFLTTEVPASVLPEAITLVEEISALLGA